MEQLAWPVPKKRRGWMPPLLMLATVVCKVAEDEENAITKAAVEKKVHADQVGKTAISPSSLSATGAPEVVDTAAKTTTGPAPAAALAPISGDTAAEEGGLKRWAATPAENFETYKRQRKTTRAEGGRGCGAACGPVGGSETGSTGCMMKPLV